MCSCLVIYLAHLCCRAPPRPVPLRSPGRDTHPRRCLPGQTQRLPTSLSGREGGGREGENIKSEEKLSDKGKGQQEILKKNEGEKDNRKCVEIKNGDREKIRGWKKGKKKGKVF